MLFELEVRPADSEIDREAWIEEKIDASRRRPMRAIRDRAEDEDSDGEGGEGLALAALALGEGGTEAEGRIQDSIRTLTFTAAGDGEAEAAGDQAGGAAATEARAEADAAGNVEDSAAPEAAVGAPADDVDATTRAEGKQPAGRRALDAMALASEEMVNARQHKAVYPTQPKQFAHKGGTITTTGGATAEEIEAGKALRMREYAAELAYDEDRRIMEERDYPPRAPRPVWCVEGAEGAASQTTPPRVQWHDALEEFEEVAVVDAGRDGNEDSDGYDTSMGDDEEPLLEGLDAVTVATVADAAANAGELGGAVAHAPQGGQGNAGHHHADNNEDNGIGTGA